MKLLSEKVKIDIGLTSAALNGAGTGQYYPMTGWKKALAIVDHGAMAAAATSVVQIMQATNAAAGSAKVVTNNAATLTANTKVAAATLTMVNATTGNVVTINDLVFTGGAAKVASTRTFDASGNDAADAASLVLCINDTTYGVPGVLATDLTGGVVGLTAIEPGDIDITVKDATATITLATTKAISYVECDASFLDSANGFDHVAIRVTNSTSQQTSAILLREGSYSPVQYVGAAKTDVA